MNKKVKNKQRITPITILLICLLLLAGFLTYKHVFKSLWVEAIDGNVSGYAWSPNIGWISFSGPNYGVNIDASTGKLSGYARADNVGWISFNESDTGAPPSSDPCADATCIAKATPASDLGKQNVNINGWARILAHDDTYDGWLRFDHGQSGEVYIDKWGKFHGWIWGGDVIGWFSCNCADGDSDYPFTCSSEGGDICQSNEYCPDSGELLDVGDSDSCCSITCQLKRCSAQGGDICESNENCPGTIIPSSDLEDCCSQTCALKTCAQQGGDICYGDDVCPGTFIPASDTTNCCDQTCELPSCAQLGGEICGRGAWCVGEIVWSSDGRCCMGYCEEWRRF